VSSFQFTHQQATSVILETSSAVLQ